MSPSSNIPFPFDIKRRLQSCHKVYYASQSPHVNFLIKGLSSNYLGCLVQRGSSFRYWIRSQSRRKCLRNPKITNFSCAICSKQNILWLNVFMYYILIMEEFKCPTYHLTATPDLLLWEITSLFYFLFNLSQQISTWCIFHQHKISILITVIQKTVVEFHYVRVIELVHETSFSYYFGLVYGFSSKLHSL